MKHIVALVILIFAPTIFVHAQTVEAVKNNEKQRIDILIDGKLFTSYRYEERIKRPALLPIMTANGNFVTRGFPTETRNGETINHPHQVGCSFVYGDVNGIDFWNTSRFRSPKELERMGRIIHRAVKKIKEAKNGLVLVVTADWVAPNGTILLNEETEFTFRADGTNREIERKTKLKAAVDITFGDNKEGLFMVHLNRALQQDNQFPVKITDEFANISEAKTNAGLTGKYLNSEGLADEKIWGTVGNWASVSGAIEGEPVTVAIFDNRKNHNFPSYMMVRPYGLLALNLFGQKAFQPEKTAREFKLKKGKTISFRYLLAIYAAKIDTNTLEADFRRFNK